MAANLTRFVLKNWLEILSRHDRSNLKTSYWSKEPLFNLSSLDTLPLVRKKTSIKYLDTGFTLLFLSKREHFVGEKTEFENESINP